MIEGCWRMTFIDDLVAPTLLQIAKRGKGIKSPQQINTAISEGEFVTRFANIYPLEPRTPTQDRNAIRNLHDPPSVMVPQMPSFRCFAIPKEADMIEVKEVMTKM